MAVGKFRWPVPMAHIVMYVVFIMTFIELYLLSATRCGSDEFQCLQHMCIPKSKVCDTVDDCGDLSDERKPCG